MINKIANVILPKMSSRRRLAKKILIKLRLKKPFHGGYYNDWSQQQRSRIDLQEQLRDMSNGPLISIVVPAFNTKQRYLDDLIYSIMSQSYEKWELILVNASTDLKAKNNIGFCSKRDSRIKVVTTDNLGISGNTNKGIKAASGEYIAFCDHDDTLEPFALYEVAMKIIEEQAELIYTDEDKISDDGETYFDAHFKPDWSPDLFTHVNYINHLTVVKKDLIYKVGLLSPNKDGAQDYDLLLRITELKPKMVHIAKVLYHWRAAENSTAQDFSSKKYVTSAGKRAIEGHFKRLGIETRVVPKAMKPGFYEIIFKPITEATIIVTPFMSDAVLRLYIELLIRRTGYKTGSVQLIVPDGTLPRFETKNIKVKTIKSGDDFLKQAVAAAKFSHLIIINRVALPHVKDWAVRLCSLLQQPHILAASPYIVQSGGYVDDCGLVKDNSGNLLNLFMRYPAFGNQTLFGNTDWVRNVDALTGGVTVLRKVQFKKFLETYKGSMYAAVRDYSYPHVYENTYNTVYTEVIMESYAIHLATIHNAQESFFNHNLLLSGNDYIPYTPEASITNILLRIAEQEGLSI